MKRAKQRSRLRVARIMWSRQSFAVVNAMMAAYFEHIDCQREAFKAMAVAARDSIVKIATENIARTIFRKPHLLATIIEKARAD